MDNNKKLELLGKINKNIAELTELYKQIPSLYANIYDLGVGHGAIVGSSEKGKREIAIAITNLEASQLWAEKATNLL